MTKKKPSDPQTAPAEAPEVLEILDRRGLLRVLSTAINETAERVSGDRFRPRDGDREKLQYLRALASLVAAYNSVIASTNDYRLDWPEDRRRRGLGGRDPRIDDLLEGFSF